MTRSLDQIKADISIAKERLKELYREYRAAMPPKRTMKQIREASEIKEKTIIDLLETIPSIEQIANKVGRSKGYVRMVILIHIDHIAHEELLAAGKATVERPNKWGGETWDADDHEVQEKEFEINLRLGKPISQRGMFSFTREHVATCERCKALVKNPKEKIKSC